ncbi:hypothetical protein [Kosakonia cowanii]|uniref:hypothetical protein n=1 Tax=Kosakonia cowanii TaxID=208223 RepID=UPI00345C477F
MNNSLAFKASHHLTFPEHYTRFLAACRCSLPLRVSTSCSPERFAFDFPHKALSSTARPRITQKFNLKPV